MGWIWMDCLYLMCFVCFLMSLSLSMCVCQIEHLQAKLEETRLSEMQLKHRLQLQTEALSSKTEELRAAMERAQDTVSSEMMELQVERMELESVKVS